MTTPAQIDFWICINGNAIILTKDTKLEFKKTGGEFTATLVQTRNDLETRCKATFLDEVGVNDMCDSFLQLIELSGKKLGEGYSYTLHDDRDAELLEGSIYMDYEEVVVE